MPTYDYVCEACGHAFEQFQSISEPELEKCPECKKKKLRRLMGTGAALMFKGSGFYTTDYRSESYKKSASADKSASGDSGKSSGDSGKSGGDSGKSESSSKKTESKPAKSSD
ncbi:MAG TPA: FmdB family zinc ribbon protein [Pirellulaceae bacterium]|jgi:putative FmdB family regulatory protein|nr:FmdB family zinc ribbon protein [Pirellulaceae bacterium]